MNKYFALALSIVGAIFLAIGIMTVSFNGRGSDGFLPVFIIAGAIMTLAGLIILYIRGNE